MIASNTAEISNTASFISSMTNCDVNFINDPDNGLSCCFEDNSNKGIFKSMIRYILLSKKKLQQTKHIYLCTTLSI